MNADGTGERSVLAGEHDERAARFSPDGKRIVFQGDATGEPQVYVAGADATKAKRLTGMPLVMTPTGERCNIIGTPGPDVLRGGAGDDVICALGGDDTLLGRGGEDTLDGGAGNDRLIGGPGVDTLLGGAGDDTLLSAGDLRRDHVDGGPGQDRARVDAGDWVSFVETIF
jgi:Ca2+-binding RTX toxin-like protein